MLLLLTYQIFINDLRMDLLVAVKEALLCKSSAAHVTLEGGGQHWTMHLKYKIAM